MSREAPLVLVADDDPDVLSLVSFRLRRAGWRVVVVGDGLHALKAIAECEPDVAVLDIGMPSRDGLDVCRAARGTLPSRSMGIVFLSARSGEREDVHAMTAVQDAKDDRPLQHSRR